jgi:hypothetical protein
MRRRRGIVLTPSGLKRLQDAIHLAEIRDNGGHRFTLEQLSDRINISTKTISRLWSLNSGVDQKTLRLCFSAFDLQLNSDDYTAIGELDEIEEEIDTPSTVSPTLLHLPYPGGPMAVDSPFYINRAPNEELAYREVTQPGCVIRIHAPRGMGKSSLTVRLLNFAESLGYRTILFDCNQIDGSYLTDLNRLLKCFCRRISMDLGVPPRLEDYWDNTVGSKLSCTLYFKQYLLQQLKAPFVLALNEVDCLFEHSPIAMEFFPMLRSWYEAARRDRDWQKVRQVVIYSTEEFPALNINFSPFNVGLPLRLPEFTSEQVQTLARRYGLNWSMEQLEPLITLVGGHPTMVQIAFYHLCCEGMTLEDLLQQAIVDGGVFRFYMRQRWLALQKHPHLVKAMAMLLESDEGVQFDPVLTEQLASQGLIRFEGNGSQFRSQHSPVQPRCYLYRIYFKQQMAVVSML